MALLQRHFAGRPAAAVHQVPQHLAYLLCGKRFAVVFRLKAVQPDAAHLGTHAGILQQRTGFFAAQSVWRKGIGGRKGMSQCPNIERKKVAVAQSPAPFHRCVLSPLPTR
jgi:hypothetical protein